MKPIISKIKNGGFIMMKKMISAAMTAIMISASVVSATGNAMYISSEKNTSDYERMIEQRTNDCTIIPEAAEYYNKRKGSDKERPVTNVWARNGNGVMYDEYIVQIEPIDGLGLAFEGDAPTSEELNALIRDKFEVSDDSVIAYNGNPTHLENGISTSYLSLKFFSTNHQANIELAKNIVDYLKDNYTVKHSEGHFNTAELCELHIDWSVFLPMDKLTDEAIEEINTALSANGYKGHFNSETKYMVFAVLFVIVDSEPPALDEAAFLSQLTPEQQLQLAEMEADGQAIAEALAEAGLQEQTAKAQLIYLSCFDGERLTDFTAYAEHFTQNDEQLIQSLNDDYGLEIDYDEFLQAYTLIANVAKGE